MDLTNLIETLQPGQRTVFDLAEALDDQGQKTGARKLTVELRRELPAEPRAPKREESPKRSHEFISAKSLAEYLQKYGTKDTVVFADPEAEVISAVLDESAHQGFQIVTMKPAPHPLWTPWAQFAGRHRDVMDFAKFVVENRRTIAQPDARELILDLSQIRASVSVEIQKGRGKTAMNGLMVTTEIKGAKEAGPVDLPETITIHAPLYVDTDARDLDLDLCIEAQSNGGVTVLVTSSAVAEARVAAFMDMVDQIRTVIAAKGATFTFGRPRHTAWNYLPELAETKPGA